MSEQSGGATLPALKVVLDNNVLVGSAYTAGSASRQVVEACLRGELIAVLSPDLKREYEHILARAVRGHDESLRSLMEGATVMGLGSAGALGAYAGYAVTVRRRWGLGVAGRLTTGLRRGAGAGNIALAFAAPARRI